MLNQKGSCSACIHQKVCFYSGTYELLSSRTRDVLKEVVDAESQLLRDLNIFTAHVECSMFRVEVGVRQSSNTLKGE